MNAEDPSAKICTISGKQISSGSSKIEFEPPPNKLLFKVRGDKFSVWKAFREK